jgi:hypothetical protein
MRVAMSLFLSLLILSGSFLPSTAPFGLRTISLLLLLMLPGCSGLLILLLQAVRGVRSFAFYSGDFVR